MNGVDKLKMYVKKNMKKKEEKGILRRRIRR